MYHDKVDMHSNLVQNDMLEYFESLKVSNADFIKIAELTKGQTKNQNWFDCRKERLTSSNFGEMCKLKASTDPLNLLKRLLYDISGPKTKYQKWGIGHEPASARKLYGMLISDSVDLLSKLT